MEKISNILGQIYTLWGRGGPFSMRRDEKKTGAVFSLFDLVPDGILFGAKSIGKL